MGAAQQAQRCVSTSTRKPAMKGRHVPNSHIPEGRSPVIPQLVVSDAHALIDFAKTVFDASDVNVMPGPDGKGVMHGAFRVQGATVSLACMATPALWNL